MKIRNISKRAWMIIGLIVLVVFLFYWYEWRPFWATRTCNHEALFKAYQLLPSLPGLDDTTTQDQKKNYDIFFQVCMRRYGP
jgi:hypothetical protein